MSLFRKKLDLKLPDSKIAYYPNFFSMDKAWNYFNAIKTETPWQQDDITVFGKSYAQPRLTALYGNNGKPYSYSNITMYPHPFKGILLAIKKRVDETAGIAFTTCLLNRYRDGKDSNGWHSDDEKELGKNPVIASISFGEPRYFHLRHKQDKSLKYKIELEHGSLLLMEGTTQHCWQHQIPKTTRTIGERINLTFRKID